jgi:hypothetical protein
MKIATFDIQFAGFWALGRTPIRRSSLPTTLPHHPTAPITPKERHSQSAPHATRPRTSPHRKSAEIPPKSQIFGHFAALLQNSATMASATQGRAQMGEILGNAEQKNNKKQKEEKSTTDSRRKSARSTNEICKNQQIFQFHRSSILQTIS